MVPGPSFDTTAPTPALPAHNEEKTYGCTGNYDGDLCERQVFIFVSQKIKGIETRCSRMHTGRAKQIVMANLRAALDTTW